MLISEVKGWHYFISWDNPNPADSRTMLQSLGRLGKLTRLQTKTSIALAPYKNTNWRQVRNAIQASLNMRYSVRGREGKIIVAFVLPANK